MSEEVEFCWLYPEDLQPDIGNIKGVLDSEFYKSNGFGVRVYRKGQIGNFKDFNGPEATVQDLSKFIF